jgi:virginiamycin B lyase
LTEIGRRALAVIILLFASAGTATPYTFTEFPIPMVADIMVAGPDGAVWFASHDPSRNTIGRITTDGTVAEFPISLTVGAARAAVFHNLAVGPDGALWFGLVRDFLPPVRHPWTMSVGRITTAGAISEFPLPSAYKLLSGITAGPDGALWFTEVNDQKLGRMTTTGEFTELPVPSSTGHLITAGPDGALWYIDGHERRIVRITTTGTVTEFPHPLAQNLIGLTPGPDGALWFTDCLAPQIGRITTAGVISTFHLPPAAQSSVDKTTPNLGACGITAGPDGALWFTETYLNKIGRITTTGELSEFPLPRAHRYPFAITAGSDGALWFTEKLLNNRGKIGRIARTDEGDIERIQLEPEITSPRPGSE